MVTDYSQEIDPWPSEWILSLFVWLASGFLWVFLAVSVVGFVYVIIFALFFFVSHLYMVSHIRGSAVRIGPEQFPEIHARIEALCTQFGFKTIPEAYIQQAGGVLNAFAMRFLRSNMIILYSELLEACGTDTGARDMIIAHELGHIRAGHLKWHWLKAPGLMVPFLGSAYSRAREYTCDRYGLAGAGTKEGALKGLTLLAAGGKYGALVNVKVFAEQKALLNTGLMTIGEWFSSHPPLAKRVIALDADLKATAPSQTRGVVTAVLIFAIPYVLFAAFALLLQTKNFSSITKAFEAYR